MIQTYFSDMATFKKIYNQSSYLANNYRQACISIITTSREVFPLMNEWMFSGQFMFEDTDFPQDPRAITDEQAGAIVKLLIEISESDVECLIVHCFAGVSRSRAVLLFFQEVILGNPIEDIKRTPYVTHNRLVYSSLVKAYRRILDEKEQTSVGKD